MKNLTIIFVSLLLISSVSAATLIRTSPAQVNSGETFFINYSTTSTYSPWYVSYREEITGGCLPASYNDYMLSESSEGKSKTKMIIAPSQNTVCVITGFYMFADGVQTSFPSAQIKVGVEAITPQAPTYCVDNTEKCENITSYKCINSNWVNQGQVKDKCGFTGTQPNECLVTINGFCIKVWMALAALGLITLIVLSNKSNGGKIK
jgi:hypothetical protein